jgi:hypothetical protein
MDVFFGLIYHNSRLLYAISLKLPNGVPKPIPFCTIWGNDTSQSIGFFFSLTIIFQSIWNFGS